MSKFDKSVLINPIGAFFTSWRGPVVISGPGNAPADFNRPVLMKWWLVRSSPLTVGKTREVATRRQDLVTTLQESAGLLQKCSKTRHTA